MSWDSSKIIGLGELLMKYTQYHILLILTKDIWNRLPNLRLFIIGIGSFF